MVKSAVNQFLFAFALVASLIYARIFVHQTIRDIFLPGIFKWKDVSNKMCGLYLGVAVCAVIFAILVLKKCNTSKWIVSSVIFGLWLLFPTYKEWDINWLDYIPYQPEDVYIIVPIILSVEHLFLMEIDTVYLLLSTIIFLEMIRGLRGTPFGRTLSMFSLKEIKIFCFSILGFLIICNQVTRYLIISAIYQNL